MISQDTNSRGAVAESLFLVFAFKKGWEVCKPFHHANAYDFVIRRKRKNFETVQVKMAYFETREERQHWVVNTRKKSGNNYTNGDFDLLFTTDGENFWLIPFKSIKEYRSSFFVDKEYFDKFKV